MSTEQARGYWDRRARENALYFVDSRLDYNSPSSDEFWAGGETAVDEILKLADARVEPTAASLDIGCGVGRLTRVLADRGQSAIGLDISSEMLARAWELNEGRANIEWIQGSGSDLQPVPDDSVDFCFSHVVFQHIPDSQITLGYIRDMGRVLRPGGRSVFVVSTDPAVHRQRPTLKHRARAAIGRAPKGGNDPAWLGSALTEEQIDEAIADGGLQLVRLEGVGTQFTVVHAAR